MDPALEEQIRRMSEPPAEKKPGIAPPRLPPTVESTLPTVKTPEEAAALSPGSEFYDPAGKRRIVPYWVTDDASYEAVPPGAHYAEGGKVQAKWKPDGGISVAAQTLYDMSHTTEGRKKALEYIYGPDAVKVDRGEVYIETPEGKRLSPKATSAGGVAKRAVGAVGGGALPVGGSVLGALGGGTGGGAVAGPGGAVAGAVTGGGAGGAAGEAANQYILKKLGVEELSTPRALSEAARAGAVGAVGTLAGGALPVLPSAAKAAAAKYAPGFLRWLGGVEPEALKVAGQIAEEGGRVPLSSYAKELPFINVLNDIAKQFGYDPVKKTAEKTWLPKVTRGLLSEVGVPEAERDVVGRTSSVSLGEAGEAAKGKAATMLSDTRTALEKRVADIRNIRERTAREGMRAEQRDIATQQAALVTEADAMSKSASKAITDDISTLDKLTDEAVKLAGPNPGDLARKFADKVVDLRKQLGRDAKQMYAAADEAAGDAAPNVAPLREWAKGLTEDVPAAVKAQYPEEIKLLEKIGGETKGPKLLGPDGEPIEAASKVTFGDLHQLRNFVRAKVDWGDMTRTPKQGLLSRLDTEINQIINDAEAVPELQEAARLLRATDDFYRENIRKFEDHTVRSIAQFHRAAAPADAERLADLALRSEGGINRERIRMIKEMGGEDLWRQVLAADQRDMLNSAGIQTGSVNPTALAAAIMKRAETGVLAEAYPAEEAARLRLQADRISRVFGNKNIPAQAGDDVVALADRADAAIRQAETLANRDPVAVYKAEMKKLSDETKKMIASGEAGIRKSPLQEFVTMEAEAAANKIISTPSLLKNVAMEFGTSSPEFVMLRQAAARRYMQDVADAIVPAAGRPSGSLGQVAGKYFNLTDEAQELLFPGTTKDQMTNLIRKVILMFPPSEADFGSALAGKSWIINPKRAAVIPKSIRTSEVVAKYTPEVFVRMGLGRLLNKISEITSSPGLVKFIAQGLDGRPPGTDAAETLLRSLMETSPRRAAVMAGAGEAGLETQKEMSEKPAARPAAPAPFPSWRERAAAGRNAPRPTPSGGIPSWRDRAKAAP